jgi:hypothetical protein
VPWMDVPVAAPAMVYPFNRLDGLTENTMREPRAVSEVLIRGQCRAFRVPDVLHGARGAVIVREGEGVPGSCVRKRTRYPSRPPTSTPDTTAHDRPKIALDS